MSTRTTIGWILLGLILGALGVGMLVEPHTRQPQISPVSVTP